MQQDFTDDPVAFYLAEVAKVPPLSRAEELACILEIRTGTSESEIAAKRLVEANLGVVVSIAKQYRSAKLHILELIQAGNDGLLKAVHSLRTTNQDGFHALATAQIHCAIAEAITKSESS